MSRRSAIFDHVDGQNSEKIDYKALYEESQRTLQKERVESGRLKKMSEENSSLRKEVEELKRKNISSGAIDSLSEEIRENVPELIQKASAEISQSVVNSQLGETKERLFQIEQESEKDRAYMKDFKEQNFENQIDAQFPNFFDDIEEGGDKHQAWTQYQKYNGSSLKSIHASYDVERMIWHINRFYKDLGVSPSRGQSFSTSDPRSSSGMYANPQRNSLGKSDKTYTVAEWKDQLEKAQKQFQRHLINRADYMKIVEELDKAAETGRVTGS